MYYPLMAWLPVLIAVIPLLAKRRFMPAAAFIIIGGLLMQFFVWLIQPSPAWPLFGFPGVMTVILLIISIGIVTLREEKLSRLAWIPAAGLILLIGTWVSGWHIFSAGTYASLIGPMETRDWTQDVQPKDPHHMAMITPDNALYLAQKTLGQQGAIGSQFTINADAITLQRVHDKLVYVIPLDFAGFTTWTSSPGGVPAYVTINAEDPESQPELVKLADGNGMIYTPGAQFWNQLQRHMREQGNFDGFSDPMFELDDAGQPWWITTAYKPTIGWSGEQITSVLVTNPHDGTTASYAVDKVPAWVDRVMPRDLTRSYIDWWGDLSGGWWNSFWNKSNLTKPEDNGTVLIYDAEGQAAWVTDVTSRSSNDDSLVGIIYTDVRTGRSVFYQVGGGGTMNAILAAVNKNQDVQYKHLTGDYVQIYNIDGVMAAVVPLLNGNSAFQGVAIAEVKNPQDVAVGTTQFEALAKFKSILARHGQQISVENAANAKALEGQLERIHQDLNTTGGLYYFTVAGTPHIFTASSQDYPKLAVAEKGDSVTLEYLDSGESILPITKFDDTSVAVAGTPAEIQVQAPSSSEPPPK